MRSASARSGSPAVTVRLAATRSRTMRKRWACLRKTRVAPSPADAPAGAHTPRRTRWSLAFWVHTLGFLDAIQTALPESFVLGDRRIASICACLSLAISLPFDGRLAPGRRSGGVADGPHALADLLPRLRQALVLVASGFEPAWPAPDSGRFWGTPRATSFRCGDALVCACWSTSSAVTTAFSAACCLAAIGAATALLSSCCTGKTSGE